MRSNNRENNALRPVSLEVGVNPYAEGSCLIKCGQTHVLCTASVEERVPIWLKNSGQGWITAEYGMLPRATATRTDREAIKGQSGRTQEIQRLIGRSLRAAVDLKALGEMCIKVDCDVLQADGGTRTASVTGGFVALYQALQKIAPQKQWTQIPCLRTICAVSCGVFDNQPLLDLDYLEDSQAQTDSNFVFTGEGTLVEVQATAERTPFETDTFLQLLALAKQGADTLTRLQKEALKIED